MADPAGGRAPFEAHEWTRDRRRRPPGGRRWMVAALALLVGGGVAITAALAGGGDAGAPSPSAGEGTAAEDQAPPAATDEATLVWSDEFDGASLDETVWEPYHSTYGHANGELQCHTPGNVEVSDGTLKLTARRERVTCPAGATRDFTSGFLGTRETETWFPAFGRYVVRARIPHGQGLWPAFWLRHRDGAVVAEVDVMEYFHSQTPGRTSANLHLGGRRNVAPTTVFVEEPTAEPGWHTWAVDIEPAEGGVRFRFYLDSDTYEDGTVYHHFVDDDPTWADAHPGEQLWDIALNLSVGGVWVGHPDGDLGVIEAGDGCAQRPAPGGGCTHDQVGTASFPATYEVDYVRVYSLG